MKEDLPLSMRLSILHHAFHRELDSILREQGLTGVQSSVLGRLQRLEHELGTEVSQKALEAASHSTHATLIEVLKKLEKKGFIASRTSIHDRRCKAISSTEKSRKLLISFRECDEAITRKLTAGLTSEQIAALYEITAVMLQNAQQLTESKKGSKKK